MIVIVGGDLDNDTILPVVVGDADHDAVAQLPADAAWELVVPIGIVAVDDDVARSIANAGNFQLDRKVGAPAEKVGDPVLEVAAAQNDAVFTG